MKIDKTQRNRIGIASIISFTIILDQLTKAWIVANIGLGRPFESAGNFLNIIHVRNTAVAFSMGDGLPDWLKILLFKVIVGVFLVVLTFLLLKEPRKFPGLEKWSFALIAGGGFGNLIDRVFRPAGVVDFIDVKFYGIFGLDRWPTFNVADSAVVIGVGILVIAFIIDIIKKLKAKKARK
ncbi:MAG: signal peptidase II [Spirochaetales bacterium]|nr:signal peptidase II [Spirochaetales bacterium]